MSSVSSKDYSPFRPGAPAPVELFVGRLREIETLQGYIRHAAAQRPRLVFLSGERGIGKSSLAHFIRFVAEQDLKAVGLHTFLGGVQELPELVRRTFDRLVKEAVDKPWYGRVQEFFGGHVKKVGLFNFSVEFTADSTELERAVHDFTPALHQLMQQLKSEKEVLVIIFDDINGLAEAPAFANWLKSQLDEMSTARDPLPVCIMLAGLDERRQSIIRRQPSLARSIDVVNIEPWSEEESAEFYRNTFHSVDIQIDDAAMAHLVKFAGGLPMLAHEIGDAVFKIDSDKRIDADDAFKGIVTAADIVGRKHIEPSVFQALRSDKYRSILRHVARGQALDGFRRSDLAAELPDNEKKVLDNFLQRMQKLGVITKDPEGGPGAYRFTNRLHALYFRLEATGSQGKP